MSVIRKAKKAYRRLWCWNNKVLKPKPMFDVPVITRIRFALRGFNANEYVWYDLEHNDYREYISEYERTLSRDINGEYKLVLDDKLLFEELLSKYVNVPEIYAWVHNGIVHGLHGNNVSNENLVKFCSEQRDLVVKWETGFEGKGTYIVHYTRNDHFLINGEECDGKRLTEIVMKHGSSIICEYMHQSAFEDELFSKSTNTLRIVCAKKRNEKNVRILRAVQRIGTEESKPVDNVSAGAMAAMIDLDTGILEQAVIAKSHNKNELFKKYDVHPDTGVKIAGKVIPNWDDIKQKIVYVTNQFPYINFVAWDVLLTEHGMCIIEGNASAGLMMFQCNGGVRNSDFGDIYRSYGIIK